MEDGKMKKLLVIASLLFTLILAGVLHGEYAQRKEVENVECKQADMNQFPVTVPDSLSIHPATSFCLPR
jgi:hypothetical protein